MKFQAQAFLAVVLSVSCLPVSHAFAPRIPQRMGSTRTLRMSEPSDTSSDPFYDDNSNKSADTVDVESESFEATPSESLVTSVMDMMSIKNAPTEKDRAKINECILKLEVLNPTEEPTTSPLLNGVWELRYAGGYALEGAIDSPIRQLALFLNSGGYSPGLFALSLAQQLPSNLIDAGNLEISICREQPRVEAKINVKAMLLGESSVTVKAQLSTESDRRLRETLESATVLDRPVEIPAKLQYSREMYVTYLDEDLLVIRDASGIPELLVRKEKVFSNAWGTEPAEVDDMAPPGQDVSPSD